MSDLLSVPTQLGDPPVREDGRCAQCGKPRKISRQAMRYAGVQLDLDPFCSSDCCRDWHGCPRNLPVGNGGGAHGIDEWELP